MERANLDGLADFECSNVNVQLLRDVSERSGNLDLTDREAQTTTGTYTSSVTNEVYRDTYSDRLLWSDFVEVNVQNSVCYWVELNLLHDSDVLLALDVDVDDINVRSVDSLAQLCERNYERESLRTVLALLLTVEVTWDHALCTGSLRSLLADNFALLA